MQTFSGIYLNRSEPGRRGIISGVQQNLFRNNFAEKPSRRPGKQEDTIRGERVKQERHVNKLPIGGMLMGSRRVMTVFSRDFNTDPDGPKGTEIIPDTSTHENRGRGFAAFLTKVNTKLKWKEYIVVYNNIYDGSQVLQEKIDLHAKEAQRKSLKDTIPPEKSANPDSFAGAVVSSALQQSEKFITRSQLQRLHDKCIDCNCTICEGEPGHLRGLGQLVALLNTLASNYGPWGIGALPANSLSLLSEFISVEFPKRHMTGYLATYANCRFTAVAAVLQHVIISLKMVEKNAFNASHAKQIGPACEPEDLPGQNKLQTEGGINKIKICNIFEIKVLHMKIDLNNCWTGTAKGSFDMKVVRLPSAHLNGKHFRESRDKGGKYGINFMFRRKPAVREEE
ncbi:hypothetical protein B0H19DRAFT_1237314 [Mycena capillaripes]|nr:hypothetical protein B0H19DRAFT_1237314 [Mycena capillaripes]